jgi:ubiquinone/menaquinone biosynthesis C-methylase UbiE
MSTGELRMQQQRVTLYGRGRSFIRKYVAHGHVRLFLQWLFTRFQSLFIKPTLLPYFITFFPYKQASYSYVLKKSPEQNGYVRGKLPEPPERLWLGYGKTIEEYLESGRKNVTQMRDLLAQTGFSFEDGSRVLELGCAGARMLRWLEDVADRCEIWGTDISGDHLTWCKENLTPPFHFFITSQHPHLPFADGYFDLIYAGSVFTHIDDMADAWMLELRRILKPGGRLYVTHHDEHSIDILINKEECHISRTLRSRRDLWENNDYNMFTIGRFMRSQVFYDSAYLQDRWKPFFDVLSVTPRGYGFQTSYLFQKR